jgi:ferredoxin--NADP+ reductase
VTLRIAIVGAGPGGFYTAEKLLKAADHDVEVELLDALPTPWGLVRAGVAPDHPNIKAVSRVYEKTAALPGFRFHGGVKVGADVTHDELAALHHAVVYTTGTAAARPLNLPGETLPGSISATDFVAWYNGHPDAVDAAFDLAGRRALVVGNGNVAIDVARMLVLAREELARTDVADHALEALAASSIEEIVVLGRRGPAQAAFTNPELRELGELTQADVVVDPAEVELDAASRAWLASDAAGATARRNVEILQDYAQRPPTGKPKRIVLRFLVSPVELRGEDRVREVLLARNTLHLDEHGALRARPTGEQELLAADLVLASVGYRGTPLPGLPFDERAGTLPNEHGRVLEAPGGERLPGVYTAGWIKRGPSGVIGTNKKCATETAGLLLEDAAAGLLPEPEGDGAALDALLAERVPHAVDYEGWRRIDEHERAAGEASERPRVKLTRLEELRERARARAEAEA